MPARCVAGGCINQRSSFVSLHQFPKDGKLKAKWIFSLKNTGTEFSRGSDWNGPDPSKSRTSQMVCSEHFELASFTLTTRLKQSNGLPCIPELEATAVPTLFGQHVRKLHRPSLEVPVRAVVRKRECARIIKEYDDAAILEKSDLRPESRTTATSFLETTLQGDSFVEVSSTPTGKTKTSRRTTKRSKSTQVNLPPLIQSTAEKPSVRKGKQSQTTLIDQGTQWDLNDIEEDQRSEPPLSCRPLSFSTPIKPCPQLNTTRMSTVSLATSMSTTYDEDDPTYDPSASELLDMSDDLQPEQSNPVQQRKFIVFEEALLSLFTICTMCYSSTTARINQIKGTFVSILQECSCGKDRVWASQPMFGQTPAGNVMLSAAVLFSGCVPTKVFRMLDFMNVQTIRLNTFWGHQRNYMWPVIDQVWISAKATMLRGIQDRGGEVTLAGDGRADSPGHSAKYGSYTFIDLQSGKVIDLQLVQSNQVKSSVHMEKEGLILAVENLKNKGIVIKELITDRHLQIQKWVRENMAETKHSYDVWHVAKAIKKKLQAIAKEKDCGEVSKWIRSISNHLYWSAASSRDDDGEMILSKWKSVSNHMQNIHSGHEGQYQTCQHGDLDSREWLKPGTKACSKVEDLVTKTRLCNDVKKLSTGFQTSDLEAFHSVVNQFAPKMYAYTYHGQLCRHHLAAMHFNENSHRQDAMTKKGEKQVKIGFPKYKPQGEYSVKIRSQAMTFGYADTLMKEVMERCTTETSTVMSTPAPPTLSSGKRKPSKEEALATLSTRFKKMKE